MMIKLHKNATTTPAVRAQIQQSSASEYELAAQYRISRTTVQRWKNRHSVEDRRSAMDYSGTTAGLGVLAIELKNRWHLSVSVDAA